MNKNFKILIVRGQPWHLGHCALANYASNEGRDRLLIFLGSTNMARSSKNPFTYEEREKMVKSYFSDKYDILNLTVMPLNDSAYDLNEWLEEVNSKIRKVAGDDYKIVLVGYERDSSSFYLRKLQERWGYELDLVKEPLANDISATRVRELWFSYIDKNSLLHSGDTSANDLKNYVPKTTYDFLIDFKNTNKEIYDNLVSEYVAIQKYKESWAKSPFPPTFIAADALVLWRKKILLVKRKKIGKGLLATPGGFINVNEKWLDCAIRELIEETRIEFYVPEKYKPSYKEDILFLNNKYSFSWKNPNLTQIFDEPDRDLRGRVITQQAVWFIPDEVEVSVKGSDDAEEAFFADFSWIKQNPKKFCGDHWKMIMFTLKKIKENSIGCHINF